MRQVHWRAAFPRKELIAPRGFEKPMAELLRHLASLRCERVGVHYVEAIDRGSNTVVDVSGVWRTRPVARDDVICIVNRAGSFGSG